MITNDDAIRAWSAYPREMIEAFGDEGDAARRYILNPVLWELLGNVAGRAMLDAGCGTGYLSRMLAQRGARVTGIEPTPPLFAYAVEREQAAPLGITYLQRDLSAAQFDQPFDVVIANMVLMDIPDYTAAIRACIVALKPGGQCIFSLLHPCFDEIERPDLIRGWAKGYIRVDEYLHPFAVPQTIGQYFHRPLSAYLNAVLDAGGALRHVIEPTLSADGIAALGANDRNLHVPSYIVISATRM